METTDGFILAILLAALAAAVMAGTILSSHAAAKKTEKRIAEQFGEIPDGEDVELASIRKPWELRRGRDPLGTIDDTTWNDLDMDEVFARLDACQTSLGEEYLYLLLHRSPDERETARREEIMERLDRSPELRLRLQVLLHRLGKRGNNGLAEFIGSAEVHALKHAWVYRLLVWLPAVFLPLIPFRPVAGTVCALGAACANILVSFFVGKRIEQDGPAVRYFSSVIALCRSICKIRDEGIADVRREIPETLSSLRGLRGALSGSIRNRAVMNEMDSMMEFIRMILLSEIRSYNKTVRLVSRNKRKCGELCEKAAELDAAIAVLSFRKSLPYFSKPHFIRNMQMNVQELYHPLLRDPVPNSAAFARSAVITGSNASGKSTFIKAVAVNGILAASLNTCTARVYQAPRALVISSMAVRDSITAGESYYISEIKSLKRVLDHVNRTPCLCFVDEILKGTNTAERIAASAAILQYLCRRDCLCLVATHDIELTRILEGDFENYHFSEQITDKDILFDYRIKPGPSTTTNAVRLLAYLDFDRGIVSGAEKLAEHFSRTGEWDGAGTP